MRVFKRVLDSGKEKVTTVNDELRRFEGSWQFESLIVEGRDVPIEALKEIRLVLRGNTFETVEPKVTYKGTFTPNLSVTPKTMDMAFTEGPEAGKTIQGIYELDGDTYKLCVGLAGKPRPSEFVSKPGSGHALEVLKRVKP